MTKLVNKKQSFVCTNPVVAQNGLTIICNRPGCTLYQTHPESKKSVNFEEEVNMEIRLTWVCAVKKLRNNIMYLKQEIINLISLCCITFSKSFVRSHL